MFLILKWEEANEKEKTTRSKSALMEILRSNKLY